MEADWSKVNETEDVNLQLDIIENSILNVLNESCPLLKKRIRGNAMDGMDSEVLNLIKKRTKQKMISIKVPAKF